MNREISLQRRMIVYGIGLLLLAQIQLRLSLDAAIPYPDLLLLLPLLAALWTPGYDGFILGLLAGFIRDYAAGRGYGLGMIVGMIFGLCASALARDGWRQYGIRGGLLAVVATAVNEWTMSLFAWLTPLNNQRASLGAAMKVSFANMPGRLLSNFVGALLLTGCLALAFFEKNAKSSHGGIMSVTEREFDG